MEIDIVPLKVNPCPQRHNLEIVVAFGLIKSHWKIFKSGMNILLAKMFHSFIIWLSSQQDKGKYGHFSVVFKMSSFWF